MSAFSRRHAPRVEEDVITVEDIINASQDYLMRTSNVADVITPRGFSDENVTDTLLSIANMMSSDKLHNNVPTNQPDEEKLLQKKAFSDDITNAAVAEALSRDLDEELEGILKLADSLEVLEQKLRTEEESRVCGGKGSKCEDSRNRNERDTGTPCLENDNEDCSGTRVRREGPLSAVVNNAAVEKEGRGRKRSRGNEELHYHVEANVKVVEVGSPPEFQDTLQRQDSAAFHDYVNIEVFNEMQLEAKRPPRISFKDIDCTITDQPLKVEDDDAVLLESPTRIKYLADDDFSDYASNEVSSKRKMISSFSEEETSTKLAYIHPSKTEQGRPDEHLSESSDESSLSDYACGDIPTGRDTFVDLIFKQHLDDEDQGQPHQQFRDSLDESDRFASADNRSSNKKTPQQPMDADHHGNTDQLSNTSSDEFEVAGGGGDAHMGSEDSPDDGDAGSKDSMTCNVGTDEADDTKEDYKHSENAGDKLKSSVTKQAVSIDPKDTNHSDINDKDNDVTSPDGISPRKGVIRRGIPRRCKQKTASLLFKLHL